MNTFILKQSVSKHVFKLVLNNPKKLNVLNKSMILELKEELKAISNSTQIKVVILAGSGGSFCAGHDLKEMFSSNNIESHKDLFLECSSLMRLMNQIPQPIIAQVDGIATAAGCQLVGTCDLAVASLNSTFAVSGINSGLFCSTPSVSLSRNIGRKHALEMLFTGDFITASKAVDYGLINCSVDKSILDETVLKLCNKICEKPKEVIALGKKMFYTQYELPIENAYKYTSEVMAKNMMLPDTMEGITAFIEKRKPNWNLNE